MKTPCQADPELWVSDVGASRREAAKLCNGCPAFDWCVKEIIKAKPTHGIWAGKDYSKNDALRPEHPTAATKVCGECKEEFPRTYQTSAQWARQRFCSNLCSASRNHRGRAA